MQAACLLKTISVKQFINANQCCTYNPLLFSSLGEAVKVIQIKIQAYTLYDIKMEKAKFKFISM
jgi:hypothetical protein